MENWAPHVTVATVVECKGRYLLVEERDKTGGALVFNQPAGHLEAGETLAAAALREVLEETGWKVALTGVLGLALYTAPGNGVTYYRTTFLGRPLQRLRSKPSDPDIHAVHWLEYEAILANSARMRSPLVLAAIEQQRRGIHYPLDLIYSA
jgi:8-oxo-dGTP pyrophosphatase MutT (NUDIX family)